ncbi:energy-coupling factor ABC transporter substrate-binding protein [Frankia sp. KB5]|uniref:energy-coupling factor ABC transporter substrate-binding protein n=1 Tax=Frankia sp. KB5 TaxID=683318 RepID=UPI000A106F35|nr:energy-coupling factor ABC transporter substrate-binding protein [Frankia sp. KB5]ORT53453.1 cobalt ABC transporter substrate-binding protein CbiN [Frankia sp. KB5]
MSRARTINLTLFLAVVVLAVAPLVLSLGDGKEEPFAGADTQAETQISKQDPGYKPWFSPLYEPPSGEVESLLFTLQAAVGAGVLGYVFGVARTRRQLPTDPPRPPLAAAAADSPALGNPGSGDPPTAAAAAASPEAAAPVASTGSAGR